MEVEQQDQEEQNIFSDTSQIEAEVSEKDEAPQAEVDNMIKLNTSPEETYNSTSSNQSASETAVEVKINSHTPSSVTQTAHHHLLITV